MQLLRPTLLIACLFAFIAALSAKASGPSQVASPGLPNLAAAAADSPARSTQPANQITTPEKSTDSGFSTDDFMGTASKTRVQPADNKGDVRVVINVPHNKMMVNKFIAYPYPMRPPKTKKEHNELPMSNKEIKQMLLSTGYSVRDSYDKAYPIGGWRWQNAYQVALKHCGKNEPHMLTELYPWMNEMVPLVRVECKKSNDRETERQQRYARAVDEYDQSRAEIEADAVRKGYFPIELKMNHFFQDHLNEVRTRLSEGTWWIIGTHRVPGLIYYWNEPIQVVKGEHPSLELNEDNALIIDGGW